MSVSLVGRQPLSEAGLPPKGKVKCSRVPDASARMEPELNPDFPPFE